MKKLTKEIKTIVDAIQDKKGRNIRVVDLRETDLCLTSFLVICEGNTPNQVSAVAQSVGAKLRDELDELPYTVDGMRNCTWVAMDYSDTVVHIFIPECRQFYDIDNLWEDAPYRDIPDLD